MDKFLMVILSIIIVVLIFKYLQAKKRSSLQEMVKNHYLKMLLLGTKNQAEFYKLLLIKYLIDSHMYDNLPVEQFNHLWMAISDDAEAWTVGSEFIMKKEGVVAPDVTEYIAAQIFKNSENKQFIAWAKMLIAWDTKHSIDDIKLAVKYREHDSFGNVILKEELEQKKKRTGNV